MILLYVWLYNENHMYVTVNILTVFSLSVLGTENMQKHFFPFLYIFWFFHFTFWRYTSSTQRLVISRQTLTSSGFLY